MNATMQNTIEKEVKMYQKITLSSLRKMFKFTYFDETFNKHPEIFV